MAVSELPGNPNAVWTVRRHVEGNYTGRTSSTVHVFCRGSGGGCLYLLQTVRPREQHLMAPLGLSLSPAVS